MKVYLSASSADIERAKFWRDKLVASDVRVTSTWIANVERVGVANPRKAERLDRRRWADACLCELQDADVFWLLTPPMTSPTRGAWSELGAAATAGKHIVCSGDTKQSIFCALASEEFSDDEAAFNYIVWHG